MIRETERRPPDSFSRTPNIRHQTTTPQTVRVWPCSTQTAAPNLTSCHRCWCCCYAATTLLLLLLQLNPPIVPGQKQRLFSASYVVRLVRPLARNKTIPSSLQEPPYLLTSLTPSAGDLPLLALLPLERFRNPTASTTSRLVQPAHPCSRSPALLTSVRQKVIHSRADHGFPPAAHFPIFAETLAVRLIPPCAPRVAPRSSIARAPAHLDAASTKHLPSPVLDHQPASLQQTAGSGPPTTHRRQQTADSRQHTTNSRR